MTSRSKVELSIAPQPSGTVQSFEASAQSPRRWSKPVLLAYGDVRHLTMGASPTTGESGNPAFRT
jgi:hypothetical protein